MKHIKVSYKMLIMAAINIVSMIALITIFTLSLQHFSATTQNTLETATRADHDTMLKQEVEGAISSIDTIYAKTTTGELTLDEAKQEAANLLRNMRYGEDGYFWADRTDGTNVVLLGSDTEGTNRMNAKDANGNSYMRDIITNGIHGGGYTDYMFPKKGETTPLPKRAYSKVDPYFGWVIGTGSYTDGIDKQIADQDAVNQAAITRTLASVFGISALFLFLTILTSVIISLDITRSLRKIKGEISTIASGDFSVPVAPALLKRRDDFGKLSAALESMKQQIGSLIREVIMQSDIMKSVTDEVADKMNALNGAIEGVSATTQELAAGMEETAASTEQISAMSSEIDTQARDMSEKSASAVSEISGIYQRASSINTRLSDAQQETEKILQDIRGNLAEALEGAKIVNEIEVLSESVMEITDETNLLALNASIEAARAGDAGRGFAVVADQIGRLADQSKEAVEKIQKVTAAVTASVTRLSEDSEHLLNYVQTSSVDTFRLTGEAMNAYTQDTSHTEELIHNFSEISGRLLDSVDGILTGINEISTASQEGAKGTSDIAGSTSDIMSSSNTINEEIAKIGSVVNTLTTNVAQFHV